MKEYLESILIDAHYALAHLHEDYTPRAIDAVERIIEAALEALSALPVSVVKEVL